MTVAPQYRTHRGRRKHNQQSEVVSAKTATPIPERSRSVQSGSMRPRVLPRAHSVGRWGEEVAGHILEANGYRLLERNWRPPTGLEHEQIRGELDLIAVDSENELVFIEVKTRSSEDFGHPFASIDRDKARRTRTMAILWCRLRENLDFTRFRIDAIAVTGTCESFTFEHLKGVA